MRGRSRSARTWPEILASVDAMSAVDPPMTEPSESTAVAHARTFERNEETSAKMLAAIERNVSDAATRSGLDKFIESRRARRTELLELEDQLEDDRTAMERVVDGLWALTWSVALLLALLPFPTFDVPTALGAVAAVCALTGAIATHARRTRHDPEWRGGLLTIAALTLAAPLATVVRILLDEGRTTFGTATVVGLAVEVTAALLLAILALLAGSPAHAAARRDRAPDSHRKDARRRQDEVERRMQELTDLLEEDDTPAYRAALAERDPAADRVTRAIVVEAIRVLYEREQIDADEAEWMLREALGRR
jgi:hypothetical protein